MASISRREGWETRYLEVLAAARSRPYRLGEHDCFRVACANVEALTGVDRWPEFAGRYTTKREALALIREYAGRHSFPVSRFTFHASRPSSPFERAFTWFFGTEPVDVRQARRGDILALATSDGEKHLGVCTGMEAAFLAETGLAFVPVRSCLCCWRIGS